MGLLKGPARAPKPESDAQQAPKSLAVAYSVRKQAGKGAAANNSLASTEAAMERPLSIATSIRRKLKPVEADDLSELDAFDDNGEALEPEALDMMYETSEVEAPAPTSRVSSIRQRMKARR